MGKRTINPGDRVKYGSILGTVREVELKAINKWPFSRAFALVDWDTGPTTMIASKLLEKEKS